MNLDDLIIKDNINKDQIEIVQKKKHEYKLLDSFSRRKGTKLFQYNPITNKLKEVVIKHSDTIHAFSTNKGWITIDFEQQKATVDSRMVYFEAINCESATKRVERYKNKLHLMCNLMPVKDGCITLF